MNLFDEIVASRREPKAREAAPVPEPAGGLFDEIVAAHREAAPVGPEPSAPATRIVGGKGGAVRMSPEKPSAPASIRAGAAVKMTPEGKRGFLEHFYGAENVAPIEGDPERFQVRAANGEWVPLIPEDALFGSFGGIPEMAGGTIEMAPSAATVLLGPAAVNPLVQGGAAAAGNVARQGVSAMLPGDDQMTAQQRLASAGTASLVGAGVQKGFNVVAPGVKGLVNKALESDAAQSAAQLAERFGLSIGEQTGNRRLLTFEGLARRGLFTAGKVAGRDLEKLQRITGLLDQQMDQLAAAPTSDLAMGGQVKRTFEAMTDTMFRHRSAQAATDFAAIDSLAGAQKVFGTGEARTAIQGIIDKYDVPGATDAAQKIVTGARRLLKELSPRPPGAPKATGLVDETGAAITKSGEPAYAGEVSGQQFQRLLQVYGEAAKGKGALFEGLDDQALSRKLSGDIFGALGRDLDGAIARADETSVLGAALKAARDNYRANSETIQALSETALGRYLGGLAQRSPEDIVQQIARMDPSEITQTVTLLNTFEPGIAGELRKNWLADVMERSRVALDKVSANAGEEFSPQKFAQAILRTEAPRFRALFAGAEAAQNEIAQAAVAAAKLADRAGTEGSQTAFIQLFWAPFRQTLATIGPQKFGEKLTDPAYRQAVIGAANAPPESKKFYAAAAQLMAILSPAGEVGADFLGNVGAAP